MHCRSSRVADLGWWCGGCGREVDSLMEVGRSNRSRRTGHGLTAMRRGAREIGSVERKGWGRSRLGSRICSGLAV